MCATALSRVSDEGTPQSAPRGARMVLRDCRKNEAVQSIGNRAWNPHFVHFLVCLDHGVCSSGYTF